VLTRGIQCRVTISMNDPIERAYKRRELIALLRLRAARVRPASIRRYLRRGYPSFWARALRAEMAAMAEDFRRRAVC
jgi:hypothetical protein